MNNVDKMFKTAQKTGPNSIKLKILKVFFNRESVESDKLVFFLSLNSQAYNRK